MKKKGGAYVNVSSFRLIIAENVLTACLPEKPSRKVKKTRILEKYYRKFVFKVQNSIML